MIFGIYLFGAVLTWYILEYLDEQKKLINFDLFDYVMFTIFWPIVLLSIIISKWSKNISKSFDQFFKYLAKKIVNLLQ